MLLYGKKSKYSFLDLGSGQLPLSPHFKGLDLFRFSCIFKNMACDLTLGLPIASNCVTHIYSSHLIEHLTYAQVDSLLSECKRVLRTGGKIRIVCPDLKKYITFYNQSGSPHFSRGAYAIFFVCQTSGHISCWDYNLLSHFLLSNGFVNVSESSCQSTSISFPVAHEPKEKAWESLYVEAQKL